MAFVINTNIQSLMAQMNLNRSQQALFQATQRLSSGLRINSAKDDAAGQAIANRMTSQINGLTQARDNAADGISLAQTTEGALDQINDNLQKVRTLMVQAKNGTNSSGDLQSIQDEIDQRVEEIGRIAQQTNFNGTKVLNGETNIAIQVGANDGEVININISGLDVSSTKIELGGINLADLKVYDSANITSPAAISSTILADMDSAINEVGRMRSKLGAIQNRFESAIDNINITNMNLTESRSRIMDTDYAAEVSNLIRAQILQQAGLSVLAMANQSSMGVLSLLQ